MTHDMSMNDGDPIDVVCETDNGCITRCKCCDDIYLEFGNFILKFDFQRFEAFKLLMFKLDYKKIEEYNKFHNIRRKIIIQVEKTNVTLALRRDEYFELLELFQIAEICLGSKDFWNKYDIGL